MNKKDAGRRFSEKPLRNSVGHKRRKNKWKNRAVRQAGEQPKGCVHLDGADGGAAKVQLRYSQ